MEVKKNLNNVQRKMLDEIYTEQFKKIEQGILNERTVGREKLEAKLLKEFAKKPEVKKYLEAGKQFFELGAKLLPLFGENGVNRSQYVSGLPSLTISSRSYYGGNSSEFPELGAYRDETSEIEQTLAEKKREMRAKIYGVNASYEEVNEEIKALLKDLI